MNRFEFFESGQGLVGARLGLVSTSMLEKYDVYKSYKEVLNGSTDPDQAAEAKKIIMQKTGCRYSGLMKSIYFFEKEDPTLFQISGKSATS